MSTVNDLSDEILDVFLDAFPTISALIGLQNPNGRLLADYRDDAEEALLAQMTAILDRVEAIDPATMSTQELVTRSVIRDQAFALTTRFQGRLVDFTICASFTAAAVDLLVTVPQVNLADQARADTYLARLGTIPEVLGVLGQRHRDGVKAGRLPVRHLVEATIEQLDRYLDGDEDPYRGPTPAEGVDQDAYRERLDTVLNEQVRPAFTVYRNLLRDEIAPVSRDTEHVGLSCLPDGAALYQRLIQVHTTTTRTATELHQIGLDIIAQLGDEYREIGARVFGTDDLTEIFERFRSDPDLRWRDADQLLDAARSAISRAEAAAPEWFGLRPEKSCEIRTVPEDEAPGAALAYYLPASLDGSRPGIYFANTYKVTERARLNSESLAFHEAVPGHHFQLSISQKLTDLPLLRRIAPFNAYAEGWGLYAERLADEMGLYSDDLSRLGMLSNDSLRAARLVVDTGLHALGWSRQQAIDYMRDNSPIAAVEAASEIDRYIADPGQALAYMVGRLEIQRIRAAAQERLGERFDIREFHDVVLGNGSLPLLVLEDLVNAWAESRQA
jgi:uncharacterized protein (DUF885 family)